MWLPIGCVALHAVLAAAVPSPWWVPNLTVVGIVLSVTSTPSRWLIACSLAGCFTMAWAIRFAQVLFAAFLLLGGAIRLLMVHWDAADRRVQCLTAVAADALMTLLACWLEGLWSWPLLVGGGLRAALTGLSLVAVRWVVPQQPSTDSGRGLPWTAS